MRFKRNLTVSFACHMNEFALCLIPMFLIFGFSIDRGSFAQYCKDMFLTYFIVLIIVNVFLILLTLVLSVFQKKSFTLKEDFLLIEDKGTESTVNYNYVKSIYIDLGSTGKMTSRPMEITLFDEKNKVLLSVTNPSILMMHRIKKKCPCAKTSYRNSKKYIWYLVLSTFLAIFTVVKYRY